MLNKDIHRQKMYNILVDIFNSNLSKYLAFKWWTACYFIHSLDRFSTDLDFDLISEYEELDIDIINILKKYWEIKKWKYNLKLSYWEDDMNIKIDINRKVWKNNKYEIINFYWTDITVQDKSTIFANKLVALTQRIANRDIYDVYFFIKNNFEINEDVIIERTWYSKNDLFIKIISILEKISENTTLGYRILDWLGEVLKDEKHKHFVKTRLVKELIGLLEFKLNFDKK